MIKKTLTAYFSTARPKTWAASLCPVGMGLALVPWKSFSISLALLTLLTGLFLQVIGNFANDYFDHDKGADTPQRLGPLRAIHYGEITHKQLKNALRLLCLLTLCIGYFLIYQGGWVIASLFLLALPMAFLYTASSYALAYRGLGELAVFLFFGPIACFGAYFLQVREFSWMPLIAGCAPGFFAIAILEVNYLRDIEEDKRSNKKTLVVRYGPVLGKAIYALCMILPNFIPFFFWSKNPFCLLASLCILPSKPLIEAICKLPPSSLHNQILAKTGAVELFYTFLFILTQTFLIAKLPHAA